MGRQTKLALLVSIEVSIDVWFILAAGECDTVPACLYNLNVSLTEAEEYSTEFGWLKASRDLCDTNPKFRVQKRTAIVLISQVATRYCTIHTVLCCSVVVSTTVL